MTAAPFPPNAVKILEARYYLRTESGELLDRGPEDLFRRVAVAVAEAEPPAQRSRRCDEFFRMMIDRDFLPNSPTLTGAGRGMSLSACFVLPIEDSLDSIFEAVKDAALVHKEGGGTGFDFSRLRPKGSFVRKTQGVASGPVSFLKVIDAATEAVKQGGTRRGANMGVLRVDHPDVEEFTALKVDGRTATNFNTSVAATDAFMDALASGGSYDLADPHLRAAAGTADARDVFRSIVGAAWAVGDPGLVFIDRINRENPTAPQGPIRATNPCGEQPLHDYESCNLGSIDVSRFFAPRRKERVDWERLGRTVRLAVRFLDDVIDVNRFPLPQIETITRGNRRIGLGVMGWADLLIRMETRYDSPAALALAERLAAFLRAEAVAASRALAAERGCFPNIEASVYRGSSMRNATVLTVAPTGTISRIAGCSSAIEPVFGFEITSRILGQEIRDVHPLFAEWTADHPGEPLPEWFQSAHDVAPEAHVRMQAAFQKHVDSSVAKTVNFRNDAAPEDIDAVFRLGWALGVKGLTVYRDGSRENQVLSRGGGAGPRERPDSLPAVSERIRTDSGHLYVTVTFRDGRPFEVFVSPGKGGYPEMAAAEALGRLASLSLRSGIDYREVVRQLEGIGGGPEGAAARAAEGGGEAAARSIPDAVAKALERLAAAGPGPYTFRCRSCGAVIPDEKCPVCPNCGWSMCA